MSRDNWLPAMIRRKPDRLIRFSYQVSDPEIPADIADRIIDLCRTRGIAVTDATNDSWIVLCNEKTRVFGFIPRDVEELITVHLEQSADRAEIGVSCNPEETHAAHLVGASGVLVFAGAAWIAGGLAGGMLPAVATIAAGWLVVEVTRHWAFDALENRIRSFVNRLGRSVWPDRPAQIIEFSDGETD